MRRAFPPQASYDRAAELFRAMGHAQRLTVLVVLSRLGPLNVTELLGHTGGEQSALSHQLRLLREQRLVRRERRGREVLYALADPHVAHMVEDAIAHVEEKESSR